MAMLGSPYWTTTKLGLITSSCCLSVSNIVLQIICVAHTTKRCRWLYRWVERPRWHCTANEDDARLSFTWTEQAECTDALTWCPCWKLPWVFGKWKPSASCRTTDCTCEVVFKDEETKEHAIMQVVCVKQHRATFADFHRQPMRLGVVRVPTCVPNEFLSAKLKEVDVTVKHIAHEVKF